jgi:iron complex outermembrane recepter protein
LRFFSWSAAPDLRTVIAAAALLLCGFAVPMYSHGQTAAVVEFDIPAQPLESALRRLAESQNLQIIFGPEDIKGVMTRSIKGRYTPRQAIEKLIEGTGLSVSSNGSNVFAIKPRAVDPRSGKSTEPVATTRIIPASGEAETAGAVAVSGRAGNNKEVIVVTGTNIRGVAPVGSPLTTITREDIEESGYGRIQDLIGSLPQNLNGISERNFGQIFDSGAANQTQGQSIDLRGVGSGGTLVLVNGRRQPQGGLEGAFIDISSIAASAVERIEILTDGASAIYGSDAIGGVVNFVLRRNYDGQETGLRLATIDRGIDEFHFSQLIGRRWGSGHILAGYQFTHRDMLMAADRFYGRFNVDYREIGGDDLRNNGGNPGSILTSANQPAFAIPAGQDGRNLTVAQLRPGQNFRDSVTGIAALPEHRQHMAFLNGTFELNNWVTVNVDGRYARRDTFSPNFRPSFLLSVPSTNPYYVNPFGGTGPVRVRLNLADDLGISAYDSATETVSLSGGVDLRAGSEWEIKADANFARETNEWEQTNQINTARANRCLSGLASSSCPGAALNVFGHGAVNDPATIDFVRESQVGTGKYTLVGGTVVADGPVFALPAGNARLAVGLDYRDENLDAIRGTLSPATGVFESSAGFVNAKISRNVRATFGELVLPILRGSGPRADFSLAARYERYSDFGDTINPKVGISVRPVPGLGLRGSWGTSFRAPRFNEISTNANAPISTARINAIDPQSPTGRSSFLQVFGPNPDLTEETAKVWTAGFDFTPTVLPGLSISSTYFFLDYRDKILRAPGSGASTLAREDLWAPVITRNPTQQQIDEVCLSPFFVATCPAVVSAIVDSRVRNIGALRVEGVDFDIRYRFAVPFGQLAFAFGGTHLFRYELATGNNAPFVSELDAVGRPLDWKLFGRLEWNRAGWSAFGNASYSDDYRDLAFNRRMGSWTRFDAGVSYRFPERGILAGTRINLTAVNLFDQRPPFVNTINGFDGANADDVGRIVSLSFTKSW